MPQHGIVTLAHITNGGFDDLVTAVNTCVTLKNLCEAELAGQADWTVEDYKDAGFSDDVAEAAHGAKEAVKAVFQTVKNNEEAFPPNAVG